MQSVEARVPEKLTISGNTDSSPLDVVLVRACDLLARTAIPRRTLGPALGVIFMLCCVLSCVAVSLGGCYIFTPAAIFYAHNTVPPLLAPEPWPWLSSYETFTSGNRPVSISGSSYLCGCRVGEAKVPGPRKREASNSGWKDGYRDPLKNQCHDVQGK